VSTSWVLSLLPRVLSITSSFRDKIYYVVLSLARFNLYANSYGFLALKMPRNRWFCFEMAGLAFFWTWFGLLLKGLPSTKMRVMYLLVSHIVTSPVHVQVSFASLSSAIRYICAYPAYTVDRTFPLCTLDRGSRAYRVIPFASTAHHYGRRLFSLDRVLPRRLAPPGYPPSFPAYTKTQFAESESNGQGILQRAGN
jgi:hypothetical protein